MKTPYTSATFLLSVAIAFLVTGLIGARHSEAQEKKPTAGNVVELVQQQKQLAQRFGKLEELFIRMSELEAAANPTRAGLLMQAAKMSKQLATLQRLSVAGDLLALGQYTRAIQEQEAGRENLKKLLELLQSENRSTRLRDERARLEDIQKEIRRLEQIQRGQTARTESGQDLKQAAADQKDIKEQLDKVASDLNTGKEESDKPEGSKEDQAKKDEQKNGEPKPSEPAESDPKTEESDSNKPKDSKPSDSKPSDSKPSDCKPSDNKPSDGKPKDSKPQEGKPSESKDPSDSNPSEKEQAEPADPSGSPKNSEPSKPESREDKARKKVESAQKRMQQAKEKLDEEKREEAVAEQREAERELREAIEELERILRQLREEEIERSLVDVETRLRRMLDLQRAVREQTEKLGNLTGDERERTLEIQANKLSIEQTKVVMEGQRALLLLQDEGSSTAFPEALEQVNADAQSVSKKLAEANVSSATQSIEDEIIGALEEMLESLKQVQKKREEKKKQQSQQQQQQSDPDDQPLVDSIAELKLLKTLQMRVNRRTQSLNQEDIVGQVVEASLQQELSALAQRQQKIHEVTRDILLKAAKD